MTVPAFVAELAEFAANSGPPAAAVHTARMSALDWLAVGRAGVEEPVSVRIRSLVESEGGTGQAALFGSRVNAPMRAAALVNGATSHALDYDDTHFAHIGHPSVAIFPAAQAVAVSRGLDVARMLTGALTGMELSIRVGLWLGRGHYQAGCHMTSTAGVFGATAAAGRLLGLDARRMAQALNLAASRSSGLKAQFGTMGKPYHAGMAASSGVECALLAESGFIAGPEALPSFCEIHHGAGAQEDARSGLGDDWLFEQVSYKFHACCHGLHAALEAAREMDIAAPEVAEMTVFTHPRWMTVCNQPAPETGLGAKFSFRTVLAMRALGYDTARLDSYSDLICADQRLRDLRGRIEVRADPDLSETGARLKLLKRDGQRAEAVHDLLTPVGAAERESRLRAKAVALIGEELAAKAWAMTGSSALASEFDELISDRSG